MTTPPRSPRTTDDHDRLIALEASLREFREALDLRLHTLNELRADVIQDRELFLRQDVYQENHRSLEASLRKDMDVVRTLLDSKENVGDAGKMSATIDGIIKRIDMLEKYQARLAGAIGILGLLFSTGVVVWEALRK